jgi:hypothetical protein
MATFEFTCFIEGVVFFANNQGTSLLGVVLISYAR